ncbi:MAG: biotin/lipoyl-binding protein, partial [Pseudomonadota bacterium]|nr:biotin/lipoyl-binding protein [Pseudomonadota bacterium]
MNRKCLPSPSSTLLWLLLPGFACLVLAACGQEADEPRDRVARQHLVEVALVQSDNLNVVRTRTGTLRARREVKVYTQEEGRITELSLYEGDKVTEGDLLVRLDDTLIRAQLSRATATRKQAEQ